MIKVLSSPVEALVHPSLREEWEDECYRTMKALRDHGFAAQILGAPVATDGSIVLMLSIGKPTTIDVGGQLQQRIQPADPEEIRALLSPSPDAPRVRKV